MIYLVNKSGVENCKVAQWASVEDVYKYFENHEVIQLDTETEGFDPYTCGLLTIQLGDRKNQFVIDCKEIDPQEFKKLLESNKTFILQNAKFDLRFFLHQGINIQHVYDTFLAEKILTNGQKVRRALDYLVSRYCGINIIDKDIRGQIHWRGLDDIVVEYAANDVKYLEDIRDKQLAKAKELELEKAISLDNKYVRVLAYTEYGGFKLDADKWQNKCEKDDKNFDEARKVLDSYIIDNNLIRYIDNQLSLFSDETTTKINWASSHQVIPLFKELGINVETIEKGVKKESVEAKVLASQVDDFEILEPYLHYKACEKKVSTYGKTWFKHINPISERLHTQFTQLMETGRLSSGGKDRATGQQNINFQNIPADETRDCFTPEEGNTFVVADYSGQEQIVLANFSNDADLIHFYEQNLGDMHSFVASKIYPEIGDDLKKIKKEHKDKRQVAKSAGFAINYGGNGFTIAQNLGISGEEGEEVYKAYFKAFPGLDKFFTKTKEAAIEDGYITFNPITKRKLFFGDIERLKEEKEKFNSQYWEIYRDHKQRNTDYFNNVLKPEVKNHFMTKSAIERKALNYPIQGSSADITKTAGVLFFKWIEDNDLLFKVLIPNFVHDEIVAECPQEMGDEVAQKLKECMEEAGTYFCKTIPLKAEPFVGMQWEH